MFMAFDSRKSGQGRGMGLARFWLKMWGAVIEEESERMLNLEKEHKRERDGSGGKQ